jgi:pyruvate/2-oxoglutarate dehydrogenase complex dihydrolipoamide dehydrogenase (E3) component
VEWLTSTTAMEQIELPDSLVVIGGGYVGMEQAQLYAHLGARVTLVGRLAPAAEPEVADTWAPYLTMAESLRIAAGLFRNQLPTSCCA